MTYGCVKMLKNRVEYISDISQFIRNSKSALNDVLDILGWQKQEINVNENDRLLTCPFYSSHRILEKNIDKHISKCSLQKNGYNDNDVFLPPAAEPGPNVIVIDEDMQEKVLRKTDISSVSGKCLERKPIPQTSDRLFSDFTVGERCMMYDYVVKNTTCHGEAIQSGSNLSFNKTNEETKPKTLEELLAAERDAKRRRIRYKSKKVHTNRKTQTEILREVIQSQMEGYEEWLNQQDSNCIKTLLKTEDSFSTGELEKTEKDEADSNRKCTVKEIVRNWDDWNYYYKGNPHKCYLKILEEERDDKLRGNSSRQSKRRDDSYDDIRDRSRYSWSSDSYRKEPYTVSRKTERSTRITSESYDYSQRYRNDENEEKHFRCEKYRETDYSHSSQKSHSSYKYHEKRKRDSSEHSSRYQYSSTRDTFHDEELRKERDYYYQRSCESSECSGKCRKYNKDNFDDDDEYKKEQSSKHHKSKHKHNKKHKKKRKKSKRHNSDKQKYEKKVESNFDEKSPCSSTNIE
ncbi:uncharacterized protein LOC142319657 [Lycorma delicatula]|uniref:uncharacterized protein LOC142319657 n=1 Tax=Lycorma delicatula TaxID=130591 RepID=UPI003F50FA3A